MGMPYKNSPWKSPGFSPPYENLVVTVWNTMRIHGYSHGMSPLGWRKTGGEIHPQTFSYKIKTYSAAYVDYCHFFSNWIQKYTDC